MKAHLTLGAAFLKHFYWVWLSLLGVFVGGSLVNFVLALLR